MKRLIIHQPTNHQSKKFRYYNYFWDLLCDDISQKYDVVTNRYSKNIHIERQNIELLMPDKKNLTVSIMDCEMIIQDIDTFDVYLLSVSDQLSAATVEVQYHPFLKKVFLSQFNEKQILGHIKDQNTYKKYFPWIYFPSNVYDFDKFFHLRKEKKLIDKFYFRGSSLEDRTILNYFDSKYFEGGSSIGSFDTYAHDIINYKIALSISGRGEFCYRDIENMAMGIPIIRFEYKNMMSPKLIPNFHYISVDNPSDMAIDRLGNNIHAQKIVEKFIEVKDNKQFLEFISKNAREFYENYLCFNNNIMYTMELLDF